MSMQCLFCFQYRVASKSCFSTMKITSWYLPSVVEWKHSFIRCWALNYLSTARLLKLINEKWFHKDSGSTKCSVNHFSTNSSRWENTNSSMAEEKVYKWGNMAWKSFCSEPIWLDLEGRSVVPPKKENFVPCFSECPTDIGNPKCCECCECDQIREHPLPVGMVHAA